MRIIDADALKETFCAECDHTISCEDCDIDFHFEHLAPTVDAEPVRHGHWILKEDFLAMCSNCGHQTFERKVVNCWADQYWERFEMPRYCSDCGAKMYLEPTKEYTDIIEDIINDWREEQNNETD